MVKKFGEKYRKKKATKAKKTKKTKGVRGAKKPPLSESEDQCSTGTKTVHIKMNKKFQIIEKIVIDDETGEQYNYNIEL